MIFQEKKDERKMKKKKYIVLMLLIFAGCILPKATGDAKEQSIHIVLDPGHGGNQSGAEERSVQEKDINLKIARYLKEELSEYEGVTVSLTRDGDYKVELPERTEIALDEDADLLVSLHNNASGPCCPYTNGCTVLVAKGDYKEDIAQEEQELACNILSELEKIGLENQGMLLRDSEAEETYEDGTLADYYAIIRNGLKNDLPSILIEHAFMDDGDDFDQYLSSDEKLEALAEADARGIARYYRLKKKDSQEILPALSDYRAKHVYVHDGDSGDYDISYVMYYEKAEEDTTQKDIPESDKKTMEQNTGIDVNNIRETNTETAKESTDKQNEKAISDKEQNTGGIITSVVMIGLGIAGFAAAGLCLLYVRKRKK